MFVLATSALFMMWAQPVTTEAPVAPTAPQAPIADPAPAASSAEDDEEALICRRKMVPHPTMLNRLKTVKVCKTKAQWASAKPRSR